MPGSHHYVLVGFANAADIEQFNGDYESDTPYDGTFYQKEALEAC